jgi:2-polyprenyl-3-methyl-5-hydroxy-6-metoxy-1,4-benzoquinol methylase
MNPCPLKPYAQAILDHHHGSKEAMLTIERDDGHTEDLDVDVFFREIWPSDRRAIDLCRGKVLDIGAGAGVHSLALQVMGLEVHAIDILPEAVEVMRGRGVEHVTCQDVMEMPSGDYDILLLLGRGIGFVEDLSGLDRFLRHARKLVADGGQLILDSCDVTKDSRTFHADYQKANIDAGRYPGQVRFRFRYGDLVGDYLTWLHVDYGTLSEYAERTRWKPGLIVQEKDGNYLARFRFF